MGLIYLTVYKNTHLAEGLNSVNRCRENNPINTSAINSHLCTQYFNLLDYVINTQTVFGINSPAHVLFSFVFGFLKSSVDFCEKFSPFIIPVCFDGQCNFLITADSIKVLFIHQLMH